MKKFDVLLTPNWRGIVVAGFVVTVVAAVAVAGVLCRPGTVTWIGMLVAMTVAGVYGAVVGVRLAFTDH